MQTKIRKISLGIVLAGILLATSCAGAASQEPTPDVAAVKTEAAMEVLAQLTVDAVLNPTATPVPPTMTPLPTATISLTSTPTTKAYYSSGGSSGGSSSSTKSGTAIPTLTPDVYICEYVGQTPPDSAQMTGWQFDVTWTIRNKGIATWDKDEYYVIWLDDDTASDMGLMGGSYDFSPHHTYKLKKDVKYNDTVDITVDFEIPTRPTDEIRNSYWGIVNDNGDIFCHFVYSVYGTYPAPTKTPVD